MAEGKDILHLTLSGGISGTINSARIAAEELRPKYPERKLYILDSLTVASGFGLLMDKLADLRDEGKTIDEAIQFANRVASITVTRSGAQSSIPSKAEL